MLRHLGVPTVSETKEPAPLLIAAYIIPSNQPLVNASLTLRRSSDSKTLLWSKRFGMIWNHSMIRFAGPRSTDLLCPDFLCS
jgi:hypothetical protein